MAIAFAMLLAIGGAAAQSGDYAESDVVTDFNTTTAEIAIEHSTVASENVDVELLLDGEVVDTVSYTAGTTGSLNAVDLSSFTEVDQIRVYPEDTNVSEVGDVTLHYDYDGTSDRTTNSAYASNQTFTDFVTSDSGLGIDLSEILWFVVVIAIMGMAFEQF